MPLGMELAVSLNADIASVRIIVTTSTAAVFWAVKKVSRETFVSNVSFVFIMLISVFFIKKKKKTIEHHILIICTYNINFKYGLKKCYISFLYCYYSQMCTLFFSFAQSYILFRTFFYIFCAHMMLNN